MEEANDLLSNGILVETAKGVVCMSLNDALTSDLNLSVEDLQTVAAQLLLQQETKTKKPLISVQSVQAINSSFVSSDGLGDSDGFTSESSEKLPIPPQVTIVEPQIEAKVPKKRGGWPKGRKRKPELLHLPPKAPSTGYNLYLNDQRKLFKDSPMPFHEITKLIGNKWSSLSLEEKKPYLEKAEEEKRRYREELREYRQSGAYQLYLANKRRKRAKYNVLSESDMDATDDLDEEDNEELYCRTCDQYFHNLHNKREHLQGKQHMQSVAGAIHSELGSDYETGNTSSFSTSLDESSLDATIQPKVEKSDLVVDHMANLIGALSKRETDIKTLQRSLKEKNSGNTALHQQYAQLKERETKLKKELASLKQQEKEMEAVTFNLWQVPSWFVISDNQKLPQ